MKTYDERAKEILEKRDGIIKERAERRKKATRLAVILAAAVLTVAVAAVAVAASVKGNTTPQMPADIKTTEINEPGTESGTGYNDGVIGPNPAADDHPGYGYDRAEAMPGYSYSKDEKSPVPSAVGPEEKAGLPEPEFSDSENDASMKAGTLTAGEWKDAAALADWKELLKKDEWAACADQRKINAADVIKVRVSDGGAPCFNVTVKLLSGETVLFTAKTDIEGCAYLFYNVITNNEQPDAVQIGDSKISLDGKTEIEADAEGSGINVTALDLMLMIDTTGSMGDELEYIKTELKDVVERVAKAGENISIRVSVNFYRDEGDEYIVRYYDFRENVNECTEQMSKETANGGGDYPEAVHTALENAVTGHNWRENAVKLCFFVLDAPPHSEQEIQGINGDMIKSVKAAAEQGIRIIPVASSGVDVDTEFVMRSFSVMTGGTYIFITNHSGIGGDHKEAEVGEHTVEYLNECMIRVACEYCGIYTGEKIPYTPTYHQ